jgi:hypothetical protein
MNERIRELAEQAGYDIGPFYTGEDNYQIPHYKDEKLEKFAELIVQECCQELWTEDCHTSDLAYLDYKNKTNKIKRHFGVE